MTISSILLRCFFRSRTRDAECVWIVAGADLSKSANKPGLVDEECSDFMGGSLSVKSDRFCSLFIFPCHQGVCPISPDFLWGLMGTSELHAAFLTESRTRGTGWGSVQEIRVSPRSLWGDVGNFTALCRRLLEFRSISEVSGSSAVIFPHLPTKSVVRYGAPALVGEEDYASLGVQSGGRKKLIWTSLAFSRPCGTAGCPIRRLVITDFGAGKWH